ncbi:MAG: hypothetical protein RIM72_04760 [Alphaproteobacteria bacterium]
MARSFIIKSAAICGTALLAACAGVGDFTVSRLHHESTYQHPQIAFLNANKEMRVEFYNIPSDIDQEQFMTVVTEEMRKGKERIDIDFTPAPAPNAPPHTRVMIAANIADNVHVRGSCAEPELLSNPQSGPVKDLTFVFCYDEDYRSSLRLEAPPIAAFQSDSYRQAIRVATRQLLPLVPRDNQPGDGCNSTLLC